MLLPGAFTGSQGREKVCKDALCTILRKKSDSLQQKQFKENLCLFCSFFFFFFLFFSFNKGLWEVSIRKITQQIHSRAVAHLDGSLQIWLKNNCHFIEFVPALSQALIHTPDQKCIKLQKTLFFCLLKIYSIHKWLKSTYLCTDCHFWNKKLKKRTKKKERKRKKIVALPTAPLVWNCLSWVWKAVIKCDILGQDLPLPHKAAQYFSGSAPLVVLRNCVDLTL